MKITKKQMNMNKKRTIELLKSTGREGIDNLVDWLLESDYFEAPASTRLDFHGCVEGGLAQHSLNVYDLFQDKCQRYGLPLAEDEQIIAAICHDLCKVNIYVPNMTKAGNRSDSKPYKVEEDFPFGHGEKSAYIANQMIDLTAQEALLIRWHQGQFEDSWEMYEHKVAKACPAIYAFQLSDNEASKCMDYKKTTS